MVAKTEISMTGALFVFSITLGIGAFAVMGLNG
jgi:hypothetical protein